jgi:hypothetical protein
MMRDALRFGRGAAQKLLWRRMKIEEISIRRIDRERERDGDKTTREEILLRALCLLVRRVSFFFFFVSAGWWWFEFPGTADGAARETSNHHHHHRVLSLHSRRREALERREKERERERERKVFVPFLCVRVYLCACASSGVFVSLNIALCAVLCAHATRSALRSEEKTLEFVTKKKRKTLSRYHTLSR